MTFNRLVKYESSVGGTNLKAIRSLNDGESFVNYFRMILAYFSIIIALFLCALQTYLKTYQVPIMKNGNTDKLFMDTPHWSVP